MVKTDILLLCLFSILSRVGASFDQDACESWMPEPVQYHVNISHPVLAKQFWIVDDILEDKDDAEWNNVTEKYVVDSLNGDVMGGFRMLGLPFRHLNTLRTLLIACICVILAELVLFGVWKIGLFETFHQIGLHAFFEKYRVAFTFVPICCIIGLLSLNDYFKTAAQITIEGLADLETSHDKSFMPIRQRIHLNLDPLVCQFKVLFKENYTADTVSAEMFLNSVVNGSWRDIAGLQNFSLPETDSEACTLFREDVNSKMHQMNVSSLFNLVKLSETLKEEYVNNTAARLTEALSIVSKALGSVDSFVERFHRDVVQLPCPVSTSRLSYFVVGITVVSMAISGVFMIFAVMQVQFKKLISRLSSYLSIVLLILFSALLKLFFLFIVSRIAFILLIQRASFENEFHLFSLSEPAEFSEAGFSYRINYGRLIKMSFLSSTTLFSLARRPEEYGKRAMKAGAETVKQKNDKRLFPLNVPVALNGTRLWNPSAKYNNTLAEITEIAVSYPESVRKACEQMGKLYREIEKSSKKSSCDDSSYLESTLKMLKMKKNAVCEGAAHLDRLSNIAKIRSKSFEFWKKHLIPEHDHGVVNRTIDNFSVMQLGLVFTNPAKKLRSQVLEPWFGMALRMLAMAPLHFMLALYLMFVIPSMIKDKTSAATENETLSSGQPTTTSNNDASN